MAMKSKGIDQDLTHIDITRKNDYGYSPESIIIDMCLVPNWDDRRKFAVRILNVPLEVCGDLWLAAANAARTSSIESVKNEQGLLDTMFAQAGEKAIDDRMDFAASNFKSLPIIRIKPLGMKKTLNERTYRQQIVPQESSTTATSTGESESESVLATYPTPRESPLLELLDDTDDEDDASGRVPILGGLRSVILAVFF